MKRRDSVKLILTAASGMFLGTRDCAHADLGAMEDRKPGVASRKHISLDGVWEIAEGGLDDLPEKFSRQVPVPGLVDMANPAFIEPGPPVPERHLWIQKDPRRDAFWYRRTFELTGPVPPVAILKIGKAMFGTRVFLNGKLLGDHLPCFTPGFFDAKAALTSGTNTVVVRVGADRAAVVGRAESGHDGEKDRYIPGIFDSVQLILSGTPHIQNVQVVPDIDSHSANVHVWLRYAGTPMMERIRVTIRDRSTGHVVGESESEVAAPAAGSPQEAIMSVPIRNCRLWTPEDPFLYQLEVRGSADSFQTKFGMRNFHFDVDHGKAILNGRPYFMRGTNVTLYRFFEDPLRGDKPWREDWVRRLHKSFRDMHWNSVRYSISFPPEAWYRIADEEGILIQDEFPIWTGDTANRHDADELAVEYREWVEDRWNHPSVVIWDGANETRDPMIASAIRKVRGLDYSSRPWDDGWDGPVDPGDPDVAHPYHFVFGPDQPFRLSRLARDPGTKAGLMIAQPGAEEKLRRKNALVINEYGGLWLNRDGSPTTLSRQAYDYLLPASATPEGRRLLYARIMAGLTEFFRAHRQAAGVMQFTGLGYSKPDGATSDDFTDIERLTRDPHFHAYLRDAFAPVGLMVGAWAEEYPAGETQEFPVLLVNDLHEDWNGKVHFRLLEGGKILEEKTTPASIKGLDTARVVFSISIPRRPADYQVEASLLTTPVGLVRSLRDFSVLTPEQQEMRRNLARGCAVASSSSSANAVRAENAVDGNGETKWIPGKHGPQWLSVDLGRSNDVSCVVLAWAYAGQPDAFSLEVSSDGSNWKLIHDQKKSNFVVDTIRFSAIAARWVRLNIPNNGTTRECSLAEFEVYH
jgi:beta-galactosidase